jgi:hypothetical protein
MMTQTQLKTWRVWFGESAVLVNAETVEEAQREAFALTDRDWAMGSERRAKLTPAFMGITKTECLTEGGEA